MFVHVISFCAFFQRLIADPMLRSVFDAGFNTKMDPCLCEQVQSVSGLIKAVVEGGGKWFESADKLHSIQLK